MCDNTSTPKKSSLDQILNELYAMAVIDIAYDGYDGFVKCKKELIAIFTDNFAEGLEMLDSLDNKCMSTILCYSTDIIEAIKSSKKREKFFNHLYSLQKKFKNVDFSTSKFYSSLYI